MSQLHNLLERLGLRYEDLTAEEKKTYTQWSETFNEKEVTTDDLKKVLPVWIESLTTELLTKEGSQRAEERLRGRILNYKMILAFIQGPEKRREWLETYLNKKINN